MSWWEKYIGIPFESRGRTADACDCYGLLMLVYKDQLDVDLPSLLLYDSTIQRKTMSNMMKTQPMLIGFESVAVDEVAPLDVLVIRQVGFDCHIGIVLDAKRILHTEAGKGVVVEDIARPHIKPRVKEAWHYVR